MQFHRDLPATSTRLFWLIFYSNERGDNETADTLFLKIVAQTPRYLVDENSGKMRRYRHIPLCVYPRIAELGMEGIPG